MAAAVTWAAFGWLAFAMGASWVMFACITVYNATIACNRGKHNPRYSHGKCQSVKSGPSHCSRHGKAPRFSYCNTPEKLQFLDTTWKPFTWKNLFLFRCVSIRESRCFSMAAAVTWAAFGRLAFAMGVSWVMFACITGKVIIEKSRGGRFLWNRNWDLGWIWAEWPTFLRS